jgi:hypothetical protein
MFMYGPSVSWMVVMLGSSCYSLRRFLILVNGTTLSTGCQGCKESQRWNAEVRRVDRDVRIHKVDSHKELNNATGWGISSKRKESVKMVRGITMTSWDGKKTWKMVERARKNNHRKSGGWGTLRMVGRRRRNCWPSRNLIVFARTNVDRIVN